MASAPPIDRVLRAVEALAEEIVDFTAAMIRIPTVNPPGAFYEDCARLIGSKLQQCGFDEQHRNDQPAVYRDDSRRIREALTKPIDR